MLENIPPTRSNLDDSLLMPSKNVVKKQIAAAATHNKITKFEIFDNMIYFY